MKTGRADVGLRAADADRDACIDQLQEHFVAGRLESWELDDRISQALRSRTQSDLDDLLADCQPARPGRNAATGRARAGWIAVAAAVTVIGGLGAAGWAGAQSPAPAQEVQVSWSSNSCDTTGVDLPDDVVCPAMSVQQEQLNEDADRAITAAEQLRQLADGWEDAEMQSLLDDANKAEEQARAAKADAQLILATAPEGKIGKNALKEPERHARDAATDASRAVIRANRIVNR